MKNRGKQGQNIVDYLRHEYNSQLDELENIVAHMENYERIIQRFIKKRNVLNTMLNSPYKCYIVNLTDEEYQRLMIELSLLNELLTGVY